MQLVNIPTGQRPCVAHFPGPSREQPFQKWLFNEISTSPISVSPPSAHMEIVCFASADVAESSPLVAQCKRLGVPLTILGTHMSREEFAERSHFNKLYLLRDHIDSGAASPYIVALDAGDILLCGDPACLASTYARHYDGKIVFGAECKFMMKTALWNGYAIDGGQADEQAKRVKLFCEEKAIGFGSWKYLNGGMMMAPRSVLREALNDAIRLAEEVPKGVYPCDQSIWMYLYAESCDSYPIALDYECLLFQNLNHAFPWDFCIDEGGDGEKSAQMRSKSGKVDAVYLFHGANTRDLSLSIRLLRKHAKNLGEIWVIGGEPTGVYGINHIPFSDPGVKNREANMTRKCLLAAHLSKITDQFALFSDDQFILAPMDLAVLPLRYKGDLERGRIETTYGQRTRETYLECLRLGLPTRNYNTHWPVPIRKRPYIEALGMVPWDTEAGDGILCRSVYGNFVGGGEFCVDSKESASDALAALSKPCLSMPNSGGESLYAVIEAAAR